MSGKYSSVGSGVGESSLYTDKKYPQSVPKTKSASRSTVSSVKGRDPSPGSQKRNILPNKASKPISTNRSTLSSSKYKQSSIKLPTPPSSARKPTPPSSASKHREPGAARPEDEVQEIKFTNVPSAWEKEDKVYSRKINTGGALDFIDTKPRRCITADLVMEHSQEQLASKVYEVNLSSSNIGKINHLDTFPHLRSLDLSCNFITKIENLSQNIDLRELKLYDNRIQCVQGLDKLREMTSLQLQHNYIQTIGKAFANLRKMKTLRIDSNRIVQIEPGELSGCSQLTSIDISSNNISHLSAINSLSNLEELIAVNNRLKNIPDLGRCRNLQEVNVSLNRLTDVSGLRGLNKLKVLNVSKNMLYNLKSVGKLGSLVELNISHNKVCELQTFKTQFHSLEILDVSDNSLEQWKDVTIVSGMVQLVELYLHGNPFNCQGEPHHHYSNDIIRMLPQLEILDGAHTRRQTLKPSTPLMRPMSANSVISARQVETQLNFLSGELASFETSLTQKYESLLSKVDTLPSRDNPSNSRPSTSGHSSRCRSRISQAQDFGSQFF